MYFQILYICLNVSVTVYSIINVYNLVPKKKKKQIYWEYYKEVYKMDVKNPGNLRAMPKITPQHLELTPMAKMRVRLCTQVLSLSMSKAMQYYLSKGCLNLKDSSETAKFTEYWNNLFDNFNQTLPWQRLKLNSDGFQVTEIIITVSSRINSLIQTIPMMAIRNTFLK
uniref:Transposable element P transposase-like GTP-binding insertion domain-containing protein n=1 Tax=Schizaphis graminum TaxID=13262 RepID=A0A2S2NVR6_SCHGA